MVKNARTWVLANCRFAAAGKAVTASIVVLKKDDGSDFQVLIARRKAEPEAGKWALPGGHIEPDESPEDGAKRELLEETGVQARQLIRISEQVIEIEGLAEKERLDIVYATMVTSDTDAVAGSDSAAVRWVPVNDLPELAFDHAVAIRSAVEKLMRQDKQAARIAKTNKKGILIAIEGIDGSGKCFGINTPILMFDGTVKKVQDVRNGELTMGDDSQPRTVSGVTSGMEMLYRVTPKKGEPYIVNESHVLALKAAGNAMHRFKEFAHQPFLNISVKDYLSKSNCFKRHALGYRKGVDFHEAEVRIDPYFLGVWLGDGTSATTEVTSIDQEIISCLQEEAARRGMSVKVKGNSEITYSIRTNGPRHYGCNSLINDLKSYNLINNKHVPFEYKKNSRSVRLQILAGLIDTDGSLSSNMFEFTNKSKMLAEDVAFLARSLGLAAYISPCVKACQTGAIGNYFRVSISGDISLIPTRIRRKQAHPRRINKDVLSVGITVEPIGVGDYYGFKVDGNHLFLLGDFTVVHNTTLADRLMDWLDDQDYPITHTKWNSADFISDAIKDCKDERCLSPMLFCLLHAADFVWRYDNVIVPALERNHIVVCDRYFYTSYVRDGLRGTDTEILDKAYKDYREPDVLFHCALPVELAYSRLLAEKGFTFYGSGMDMGLSKSREESCMKYEQLMDKEYKKILPKQQNYVKLDTNRSEKEVFKAAKKELTDRFGIGGYE